VTGSKTEH